MRGHKWNPFNTNSPELGNQRLKSRLAGKGNVILRGSPRDLMSLALDYSANPTIWKRMLHSRFNSPFRRAVQSPGAALSAASKCVGFAIKQTPIKPLNMLLDKAYKIASKKVRSHLHKTEIQRCPTPANKVKFSLKALGGEVSKLDSYRWKITHAIDQYNKAVEAVNDMKGKPCDKWVIVVAKFKYLNKRIFKLRTSVDSVIAVCNETLVWLDEVEKTCDEVAIKMAPQFKIDEKQLKQFAGAHETCSEEFCMFKDKRWTSKKSVPTSSLADFFVRATGAVSSESTASDIPNGAKSFF